MVVEASEAEGDGDTVLPLERESEQVGLVQQRSLVGGDGEDRALLDHRARFEPARREHAPYRGWTTPRGTPSRDR